MKIAIDGTAGSGKGTLSKRLSKKLGFPYLDTGMLYRKIALEFFKTNKKKSIIFNKQTISLIKSLIKKINFNDFKTQKVLRDDKIGLLASEIAKIQVIRKFLNLKQLDFVRDSLKNKKGCILDGRDIGTVILPDADIKFFVTASAEVRAKRRLLENKSTNLHINKQKCTFNDYLIKIIERDENDYNRKNSPLKKASDAIEIDTSLLSPKEVEEIAINKIYKKNT